LPSEVIEVNGRSSPRKLLRVDADFLLAIDDGVQRRA
jgi:hypothetical protein